MAESPSGWTTPDDQPDDQGAAPAPPAPSPASAPPAPQLPANPGWGAPPPGGGPGWGPPPSSSSNGQPGWGPPPPSNGQPGWGPPTGTWSTGGWSNRGPGIVPLRPLSVGEILEGSVRAMRANPRTMVGFSAIVIAVLALLVAVPQALALSTLLNSPLTDPRRSQNLHASDVTGLAGAGGLTLAIGLLQFVLATTIVSALLIMAVDSAVRGRSLQPGQLWGRVRPRLLAVIGLALLVPIVFLLTIVVALVPGLVFVFIPGTAFTVIGVILLVVGAIAGFLGSAALYLGFWAVAAPALLLENLGVLAALRRSYRLVRGMFWRVLGIGLLTAVMAAVLREVFAVLPSAIGGIVADTMNSHGFAPALVQLLITDVGTVLAGAVLYPFTAGVSALLYLDLRMRHEGLDVELMRQ